MADDFYRNLEGVVGTPRMSAIKRYSTVDWPTVSAHVAGIADRQIENADDPDHSKIDASVPLSRINKDALLSGITYTPARALDLHQAGFDVYSYGVCLSRNLHKECETADIPLFYAHSIYTMAHGSMLFWYAPSSIDASEDEKADLMETANADMKARNARAGPGDPQIIKLSLVSYPESIAKYFPQNGVGQRLLVLTKDNDRVPLPVYLERFPPILRYLDPDIDEYQPQFIAFERCLYNTNSWSDYQTLGHVMDTLSNDDRAADRLAIKIMIMARGDFYRHVGLTVALSGFH